MQIQITNKQLADTLSQCKINLKNKSKETKDVLAKYAVNDLFSVEDFWLKTIEVVGFRHYHQVNVFLQNLEKSGNVRRCTTKKKSQITGNKCLQYKRIK